LPPTFLQFQSPPPLLLSPPIPRLYISNLSLPLSMLTNNITSTSTTINIGITLSYIIGLNIIICLL
jgi:hypothetical protein